MSTEEERAKDVAAILLWGAVYMLFLAAPLAFAARLSYLIAKWAWGLIALAIVVGALAAPSSAGAACHDHACVVSSQRHYMLRVIRPYVPWLRSTGHCESDRSAHGYSLHAGLRAIGGGGAYRGRYQMGFPAWQKAGGHGDPAAADWLEQAYRAVRWRKIIARYGVGPHSSMGWPVCG